MDISSLWLCKDQSLAIKWNEARDCQPTNQLAPPNNSINQQSSSIKDLTAQAYRNHIATISQSTGKNSIQSETVAVQL